LPELETWIETWAFSETIHSRSYTHIIRNILTEPGRVFDDIVQNPHIVERAKDIARYYDDLIDYGALYNQLGEGTHQIGEGTHQIGARQVTLSRRELKKTLY